MGPGREARVPVCIQDEGEALGECVEIHGRERGEEACVRGPDGAGEGGAVVEVALGEGVGGCVEGGVV